jgi:hypothetical protein
MKLEPQFQDFITMIPKALPKKLCEKIIKAYHELDNKNETTPGLVGGVGHQGNINKAAKNSRDVEIGAYYPYRTLLYEINKHLQICYNVYMDKYWQVGQYLDKHAVTAWQIQRYSTRDQGGYHAFHIENNGVHNMRRVMAYIVYLNDIKEGGETEFLHQNIRVKPETGKVIIFPAYFTHVHRGNPVLSSEDKYILTGWLEYV